MGASRQTDLLRATPFYPFDNFRTNSAKMEMQKEEFVVWVRQAMAEKKSIAAQEMYHFHALVEEAAILPRKYGYAPKSSDMYPSDAARKKAREEQFDTIDTMKQGYISLEEWIKWSTNHIMGKVDGLPKDYLGEGSPCSKAEFIAFIKRATAKSS